MGIMNRLTANRGEVAGGQGRKEEKGSSQGTCIKDPWSWTIGGGLTVVTKRGCGWGRAEQWGENWDSCNRTTIKYNKIKYK